MLRQITWSDESGMTPIMHAAGTLDVMATAARVPGSAKDGGPNCATVKPFHGWSLVE